MGLSLEVGILADLRENDEERYQYFKSQLEIERRFDHLIVHSDAEGFYVPIEFPDVLYADEEGRWPVVCSVHPIAY